VSEAPSIAASLRREKVFKSLFGRSDGAPLTIARFTLLECIGAGGMGELYAAYDAQLDRKVAIKLVRPDRRRGPDSEQRLLREAQAAARLSHPNVVQVYEAGVVDGRVFIAMEFVHGGDLRTWLSAAPRSDAEILARFIEAGRGLEAVHEAGLAHRDFKPANALVGADGRVRIVDFGLARIVSDARVDGEPASAAEAQVNSDLDLSDAERRPLATMTAPGTIMGTPRYMAPEQRRGARGDARSDQFSFCVALYEALYGAPPFQGERAEELLEAIAAGRIEPARRELELPRSPRAAIVRGLEHEPSRRWPSIGALLTELEGVFVVPERRWLKHGLFAAALAILGIGLGLASLREPTPRCAIDEQVFAGSWDRSQRDALVHAFEATGSRFAPRSAETVVERLDAWSRAWRTSQREACEATWIEGVQSEALLDQRTACLARKRQAFEVVVDAFVDADREVVARIEELLDELPDLGECSNPRALASGTPMPSEREASARVLAGYEALARARVLAQRGFSARAEAVAQTLLADPYAPLAIEARAFIASASIHVALEPALLGLRDAANAAERLGLLELEAEIRVRLAREAVGDWSKPELEAWLIDEAELLLERLAQPEDPRRLVLLAARARLHEQRSDYAGARALIERGLALGPPNGPSVTSLRLDLANLERKLANYDAAQAIYLELLASLRERWGDGHPVLASIQYNLGVLALDRGEFEGAQRWLTEARAHARAQLGPETVDVADIDFALAKLALSQGEFELARAQIEALLPIYTAQLGSNHESTARAHAALGVVQFYTGDLAGSLTSYRRALPIFEQVLGPSNDEVALMHANIGESLLGLGRHAEAVEACDRAIELLEAVLPLDHPYLGVPLKVRGHALLDGGQPSAAVVDLERAVGLLAAEASEPLELADARFALAQALLADPHAEDLHARASSLLTSASAGFAALGLDERVAAVERWRPPAPRDPIGPAKPPK